jgi:hypothetical protein
VPPVRTSAGRKEQQTEAQHHRPHSHTSSQQALDLTIVQLTLGHSACGRPILASGLLVRPPQRRRDPLVTILMM